METLVSSTAKVDVETTWMVEPVSNWKLPVRVARALVTLGQGDMPVHFINTGTIVPTSKGTTVGVLEAFHEANLTAIFPQQTEEPHANADTHSMTNQLWIVIKDNHELEPEQKEKMVKFKDILSPNHGDIRCTSQVQHSIETGNAPTIHQHVHRTAPALQEQVQEADTRDVR